MAMDPQKKKEFWEYIEKTAQKVDSWPEWMKGGEPRRVAKSTGEEGTSTSSKKSQEK